MKKQLLAGLIATVAALVGLVMIPSYEDCGGVVLASFVVTLGASRFM